MGYVAGRSAGRSKWLWGAALIFVLQACGGGSSESGEQAATATVPVSFIKRAGNSTYAGSSVTVEFYDSVNGWQELTEMTTSDSGSLEERGLFDTSEAEFVDQTWYRLTVTAGENQDADRDGVLDSEGAPVKGRLRSLAKGEWLQRQGGSHISAATEFAYTSLHKLLLENEIDWVAVETGLDTAAEKLLLEDQTGDGTLTAEDLLVQDPQSLEQNLQFFQRNQLVDLGELVEAGLSSQLVGRMNDRILGASNTGIYEVVMDSEGRMVYAAVSRDGVLIYDARTGVETVVGTKVSITTRLTLSENRERLFVAGGNGGVEVIDLVTQTLLDPLLSTYGYVNDVQVSPDEKSLYVATGAGLLVYDLDADTYEEFLYGSCQRITLSEEGSRVGLGCYSGIQVFDVASNEMTHDISLPSAAHTVLLDGGLAYVANQGDGLTIVELDTGDYSSYPAPNGESLEAIAAHADENTLAVFPLEGNYAFDLSSRTYLGELFSEFHNESTEYVLYSEESDTYVFDYEGYAAGVLKTSDIMSVIDDSNYIYNVYSGPAGEKIYYADYYGDFDIYEPASGTTVTVTFPGDLGAFVINEAETLAYVMWRENGFYVLDLNDGSYEAVDVDKKFAHPVLDESDGLLYVINYGAYTVEVYSTADHSLQATLDLGTCEPIALRMSDVEHALDVSCRRNGIKRVDLDTRNWVQIMEGSFLYSFDYNADESLMYIRRGSNLVIHDMVADAEVKAISYTGGNADMVVFSTYYWPEMNAVILGGNQGARFVSLEMEKQFWLHREFGNRFALDKANRHLYLAAGNDAGLLLLDMSDFE